MNRRFSTCALASSIRPVRILLGLVTVFAAAGLPPNPADAFQPNTLRAGSLEIHPSFLTEATYNDNITLTRDKVSDVIFRQVPGLSLEWGRAYTPVQLPRLASPHGVPLELLVDLYLLRIREMGERGYMGRNRPSPPPGRPVESALLSTLRFRKIAFSLDYQAMFINLVDNPEFDSIDHELTFLGELRLPSGFYMRLDDFFLKSNAINNFRDEVVDFGTLLRTQGIGYTSNQSSLTFGYNFYADWLAFVTYSNSLFFVNNFEPARLLAGVDLPGLEDLELVGAGENNLGFVLQTVGAYLSKPIHRRNVLTVGYLIGWVQGNLQDFSLQGSIGGLVPVRIRVTGDPRNAVFHEVQLRFSRVLQAKKWAFGVGIPKTTLETAFAYQWRDFDQTEVEVDVLGSPLLTVPVKREGFQDFFVDLRLNSEVRPRTDVMLAFSRYPKEEIAGSGNVSINYRFFASVTQRIRQKWQAGALGAFRIRESPFQDAVEGTSFNYEAGANISYNLQSWLKTSIIYQFLARNGEMDYNDFQGQRVRFQIFLYF
jgi:hypothetical protein